MNTTVLFEYESYRETIILNESHAEKETLQMYVRVVECSDNGIVKLYRVEWMFTKNHHWQHKAVYTWLDALRVFYSHVGMDTLLYNMANSVIDYTHATGDESLIDALQHIQLVSSELLHRYEKIGVK